MAPQELINLVLQRFELGEKDTKIKESLLGDGWHEDEIDEAISKVKKTFLPQESPEQETIQKSHLSFKEVLSDISPRGKYILLAGLVFFAIISFSVWNLILFPGTNPEQRDLERSKVRSSLTNALNNYFNQNDYTYPNSLEELVPENIDTLPLDPKTRRPYDYTVSENGNYKLCINYELKKVECIQTYYVKDDE